MAARHEHIRGQTGAHSNGESLQSHYIINNSPYKYVQRTKSSVVEINE